MKRRKGARAQAFVAQGELEPAQPEQEDPTKKARGGVRLAIENLIRSGYLASWELFLRASGFLAMQIPSSFKRWCPARCDESQSCPLSLLRCPPWCQEISVFRSKKPSGFEKNRGQFECPITRKSCVGCSRSLWGGSVKVRCNSPAAQKSAVGRREPRWKWYPPPLALGEYVKCTGCARSLIANKTPKRVLLPVINVAAVSCEC